VGNGVLEEQRKGLILYCTTRHTSLKFPSRHIFAQQPFSLRIQHFFSTDISFSADICCALFNSQIPFSSRIDGICKEIPLAPYPCHTNHHRPVCKPRPLPTSRLRLG